MKNSDYIVICFVFLNYIWYNIQQQQQKYKENPSQYDEKTIKMLKRYWRKRFNVWKFCRLEKNTAYIAVCRHSQSYKSLNRLFRSSLFVVQNGGDGNIIVVGRCCRHHRSLFMFGVGIRHWRPLFNFNMYFRSTQIRRKRSTKSSIAIFLLVYYCYCCSL